MMRCLQDSMRNILRWVTIYDPFASNLGIDKNWNRLDYPWIFIVPSPFFLYVESRLCKPKSSVFSYTDCIQIVIQQTRDHWKWSSAHDIAQLTTNIAAEFWTHTISWT